VDLSGYAVSPLRQGDVTLSLISAHRRASVRRVRSDGVGPSPHRAAAVPAERTRGLLLFQNGEPWISAEATTSNGTVEMTICRSIVEAHGGRLSASDKVGPGATLEFALPPPESVAS
jgi:light-regulated signal transduction histidine kinase (bacteriophytochrome)